VKALVHSAGEYKFDVQLLKSVEAVNKRQKTLRSARSAPISRVT